MPAEAQTFNLVVDYSCTDGVAGNAPVTLTARVKIPTSVQTGSMLSLGWAVEYTGTRRFMSPGYFPPGAQVSLVGNVKLEGAWNGVLQPRGVEEQGALQPNQRLEAPEGMSSEAHMTEEGVIRLTPQNLTVDFVPPAGEEIVNNDELDRITYKGPGWAYQGSLPMQYGDHGRDLHTTSNRTDEAVIKFHGTGFEVLGRRMPDVGRIRVIIDDDESAIVDTSRTETGEPTNVIQGNSTLWRRDDLPYGFHRLAVRALDDGKNIHLDAFKLLTAEMINPPTLHRATCTITNNPGTVEINVGGSTPGPTDTGSPTSTPTDTDPPTDDPTDTTSPTPSTSTTTPGRHPFPSASGHVSVVVPGATTTPTATPTVNPTVTNYKAQVLATPTGGVDTGEAPERETGSPGLLLGGSLLLMGSVTGGLLMRRRRAEHAGGMDR
ncbi:hypothetical protein OUY22_16570 [Nonomuraea sp. MCN248]|uniref:LPXTG cell wall anchor domain-containing protein n=1 Tax=Nonomuraea corallina TaxID=2989783 RepID=A0ABT4SCW1_9ACTN|nr:hypothetical protein [Nonomuraea corallina]MDA0635034.1 hypothetical protein [Nonomuraea corallina]